MTESNVLQVDQINGRPVKIVYEAASGVIFHITPINLATLRAIQLKAQEVHPYPDAKPFQVEDPPEVAFTPGQLSPPEENPAYIEACKAVDLKRSQWTDRAVFDYAATMPQYSTAETLIEAFNPQLKALKKIATFDALDSDYDIVLLHLVLTGITDYVQIIRLAVQQTPLTPAEVSAGIRFFRSKV